VLPDIQHLLHIFINSNEKDLVISETIRLIFLVLSNNLDIAHPKKSEHERNAGAS